MKAAGVPSSADTTAVEIATTRLFCSAGQMIRFSKACSYHFSVKPLSGKIPVTLELNDRTTSISTGRNRKSSVRPE